MLTKEAGLAEKYYADVLTTQEIDGSELAGLTEDKLERWGLPGGPAGKLVTAAARLWKCNAIHGVVLAPVDDRPSKIDTEGESHFVALRGKDARYHLGGLDQIFRHMS